MSNLIRDETGEEPSGSSTLVAQEGGLIIFLIMVFLMDNTLQKFPVEEPSGFWRMTAYSSCRKSDNLLHPPLQVLMNDSCRRILTAFFSSSGSDERFVSKNP
jgi:hypothetical protein